MTLVSLDDIQYNINQSAHRLVYDECQVNNPSNEELLLS